MSKKDSRREVEVEQQPQLSPVAVLTITYLPQQDAIGNIQAIFPPNIDAASALHVLRRAEEVLIAEMARAKISSQVNNSDT